MIVSIKNKNISEINFSGTVNDPFASFHRLLNSRSSKGIKQDVYSGSSSFDDIFDPYVIEQIKRAIKPFQYTKEDLVANPEKFNFKVRIEGDNLVLTNFHNDPNSTMGICEELAYKASKKLNKLFKGRFIFFVASHFDDDYNMGHLALRGIPVSKINILRILKSNHLKIKKLIDLFDAEQNQYKKNLYLQRLDEIVKQDAELMKQTLFIDPSFQEVMPTVKHPKAQHILKGPVMRRQSLYPASLTSEARELKYKIWTTNSGTEVILGFAKNYLRNFVNVSDTAILSLGFAKLYDSLAIFYELVDKNRGSSFLDINKIPSDSVLRKFANYIYMQILRSRFRI